MVLLEVPEGTVAIQDSAYKDRTDITVVRIPASVKAIRFGAFDGCSGITTLHFAEGLESIGESAFRRCPGIVGLHLPESVRSIEDRAFQSCTGITSLRIPPRVQSIDTFAFASCTGIAVLDLAEGLESIRQGAFYNCTSLKTLVLPASITSIGDHAVCGSFADCTKLARVFASDALVKGDMADPSRVFKRCPALASGLTTFSAIKLPRRRFWHPTMHALCNSAGRACVLAVLVAELRVDRQEDPWLPSLAHDSWLLILEFVPRHELGAPPLPTAV